MRIDLFYFSKLLALGHFLWSVQGLKSNLSPLTVYEGLFARRHNLLTSYCYKRDDVFELELNLCGKMPKRSRPKSSKPTKSAHSKPKRATIPRSCKYLTPPSKTLSEFDFLNSSKNKYSGNPFSDFDQVKSMSASKCDSKKEEVSVASGDELDVVFDLQEDKKNRIYEVITVMSDDETPNKVTYERLYAEDPDQRVIMETPPESLKKEESSSTSINNDIIGDLVKETNLIKENEVSTIKHTQDSVDVQDSKPVVNVESDDEIVCIGVVDAKTKEEQRRATIEEICLSSDSESETMPKVPSIKVKIPPNTYPYVSQYNPAPFVPVYYPPNYMSGYRRETFFTQNRFRRRRKQSDSSVSDWDSLSKSSSPNPISSDESSNSKISLEDESSRSSISNRATPQPTFSSDTEGENSNFKLRNNEEDYDNYRKDAQVLEKKQELRHEEFTTFGKSVHEGKTILDPKTTFTFKVMSYNVLSQKMLENHMYLYKDHDRRALSWAKRWNLLFKEIRDESPEVLCLQEVEHSHLVTEYSKILDLGYKWVYKKRTNSYSDGEAVFYKSSVFDEEARSAVEFYQPGVSVLDRDNVGIVLRLRLKNHPRQAIVIATTHLLFNPKRSDVKLAQLQVLLAEIDRLAYNKDAHTYYPVIMTGDFNLKPKNGVYKLVTEGELKYEGMSRTSMTATDDFNVLPKTLLPYRLGITDHCQHVNVLSARVKGEESNLTQLYHSGDNNNPQQKENEDMSKDDRFESGKLHHSFNFNSVYPHVKEDGQKEGSTNHDDNWVSVDYIFYSTRKSSSNTEGGLQLLSRLRLPTQDEYNRYIRHLPNLAYGSDHLPLVAKFLLQLH